MGLLKRLVGFLLIVIVSILNGIGIEKENNIENNIENSIENNTVQIQEKSLPVYTPDFLCGKVEEVNNDKILFNHREYISNNDEYEFIDGITNKKCNFNDIKENNYLIVTDENKVIIFNNFSRDAVKKIIELNSKFKNNDENIICNDIDSYKSDYSYGRIYEYDNEKIYFYGNYYDVGYKLHYITNNRYEFLDGLTNKEYDLKNIKENDYIIISTDCKVYIFPQWTTEFINKSLSLDPQFKEDSEIIMNINIKNINIIDENTGIATIIMEGYEYLVEDINDTIIDVEFDKNSIINEYYKVYDMKTFMEYISDYIILDTEELSNENLKIKRFCYYYSC